MSFSVEEGEFVGIMGASGSGKTTLLNCISAIDTVTAGHIYLDGEDITALPDSKLAQFRLNHLGFVFQDHRLMPQYTVLENILLPALAYASRTGKEETEYAHRLLELTHISGVAHQYPSTLSGGEASRVAVCRALIMKPKLLLADEPTGQLDAENAWNIASLLSEINQNLQTTIVMVTHSEETSSVAHRILTLKEGILR